MRKELLSQFEDLELFTEKVEYALEEARKQTEYPVDLRMYVGDFTHEIYTTPASVSDFLEIFEDALRFFVTHDYTDETFIDLYENNPAEAAYFGITIWLDYVDGRIKTRVEC